MAVDNSAKQVEGHSLKIFLSYSRKDEVAADDIHRRLSSLGITVWYDKESLLPGQEWEAEIKKTIRNSDLVIVLLSTNSVSKRGFFLRELKIALDILDEIPTGHLYLIPVRLDDCKIPDRIASIHHIDLFPKWDNGFKKLLLSLQLEGEKLRHDRTDVQKTLERLEAFVRSPMSAASLDDLARLLSRPDKARRR